MRPRRPPAPDVVFLKLGGALLTEKDRRETVRRDVLRRLAHELATWRQANRATQLVLAHGSGSFAHMAVRDSGFLEQPDRPAAAAAVSAAARRLDRLVVDALLAEGLAPVAVPGSVLARCDDGAVTAVRSDIVRAMLAAGWLPVVYGDVAPDATRGACIASTEPLLAALAADLAPRRIVLATDVDGVYEADPHGDPTARPLERLDRRAAAAIRLGGARGEVTDVTGGMAGKVEAMLALVERRPGLVVHIVSGLRPGAVPAALAGDPSAGGTRLVAEAD
jgi:isopentenyl phosphate kinase